MSERYNSGLKAIYEAVSGPCPSSASTTTSATQSQRSSSPGNFAAISDAVREAHRSSSKNSAAANWDAIVSEMNSRLPGATRRGSRPTKEGLTGWDRAVAIVNSESGF